MASKNMLTRNRLEAWVHQIQGNHNDILKYSIKLVRDRYSPKVSVDDAENIIGAVYMKKETAEWICERLHDGRITL